MRPGLIRFAKLSELRRLVRSCDVGIVVLDARNPMGTFSKALWSLLEGEGKRKVIVLNKADLVPARVAFEWAAKLQRELGAPALPVAATKRMGTLKLRRELRAIARELRGEKEKVVCLIAGVPKTGKSSIINVLKGKRSASTSSYPGSCGYTKAYSLYRVEGRIYVIDTPGVAPDVPDELERLVRLYPPEHVPDPVGVAAKLLERARSVNPRALEEVYGVSASSPLEALELIAKKRGWVKRGTGEPIVEQAAVAVIRDYLSGELPFYVEP